MKRYVVYTDAGEWRDVWARSAEEAKAVVWRRTLGRAGSMVAVRER